MSWQKIEIDHVKSIYLFDKPKDEQLKGASNWRNKPPFFKEVHQQKVVKFSLLDYRLHFIKPYHFLKLNDEGCNYNLHQ